MILFLLAKYRAHRRVRGDSRLPGSGDCFHSPDGKELGNMSTIFKAVGRPRVKSIRQIEVLVVQSNPADTLLTIEALKAAGLTNGLRCVSEGKDAQIGRAHV